MGILSMLLSIRFTLSVRIANESIRTMIQPQIARLHAAQEEEMSLFELTSCVN